VLLDVLGATQWTNVALAARLGVSTKTVGRYLHGQAVPPAARRHGILAALRDLEPSMLLRVAASLGLAEDALPRRPPPPADLNALQPIVEAAAQEVAERVDSGPIRVRAALAGFIARLAEGNVDMRSAHALLTRR
jgi:transcriptional regulator with XRE-family HTH domain